MSTVRYFVLGMAGVVLASCHSSPPPPPTTQVTVSCHKNWYGERVCTRSVSKY